MKNEKQKATSASPLIAQLAFVSLSAYSDSRALCRSARMEIKQYDTKMKACIKAQKSSQSAVEHCAFLLRGPCVYPIFMPTLTRPWPRSAIAINETHKFGLSVSLSQAGEIFWGFCVHCPGRHVMMGCHLTWSVTMEQRTFVERSVSGWEGPVNATPAIKSWVHAATTASKSGGQCGEQIVTLASLCTSFKWWSQLSMRPVRVGQCAEFALHEASSTWTPQGGIVHAQLHCKHQMIVMENAMQSPAVAKDKAKLCSCIQSLSWSWTKCHRVSRRQQRSLNMSNKKRRICQITAFNCCILWMCSLFSTCHHTNSTYDISFWWHVVFPWPKVDALKWNKKHVWWYPKNVHEKTEVMQFLFWRWEQETKSVMTH